MNIKEGVTGQILSSLSIKFSPILNLDSDKASTMEIALNFSNGLLALYSKVHILYIATIYKQPDDRLGHHRSTDKEIQEAINKLKTSLSSLPTPSPNVIFYGDFNIPHSSWPQGSATSGASTFEKIMLETLSTL